MGPLVRRVVAGALAGVVGTVAMDLVWYRRYRSGGGGVSFPEWEFATSTTSFEDASAPGRVGERVADLVGIDLPDEAAGTTTNVVHWLTGVGYGVGHALVRGDRHPAVGGVATGVSAFANSYGTLGALGVYDPIWDYDLETLRKDLSAHLAFGVATSIAYRVLVGRGR